MRWFAVIVWMLVIFVLSSEHFSAARVSLIDPSLGEFAVRKMAHLGVYFVLGVLLSRALSQTQSTTGTLRRIALVIFLVIVYAMTDEWHQSFVKDRNSQFSDVVIDAIGGFFGTSSWFRYYRRFSDPEAADREGHQTT